MAEDQTEDPKDQTGPPEDLEKDQTGPPEDPEKGPEKDPEKDLDPEVKKAIRRRDAAVAARQKAEEELKKLKEKYEPEKADPVKVANRRLVGMASKVVLAGAGLTEPEDQKELATFLGLDDVAVDDDGTVDQDAIQDRLDTLVRIVGKLAKKDATKRVPRVDTRDRNGERPPQQDAATRRRQDMLQGR